VPLEIGEDVLDHKRVPLRPLQHRVTATIVQRSDQGRCRGEQIVKLLRTGS
jgi:hypothetical protein